MATKTKVKGSKTAQTKKAQKTLKNFHNFVKIVFYKFIILSFWLFYFDSKMYNPGSDNVASMTSDWNENWAYLAFLPCIFLFIGLYYCMRANINFENDLTQLQIKNFDKNFQQSGIIAKLRKRPDSQGCRVNT